MSITVLRSRPRSGTIGPQLGVYGNSKARKDHPVGQVWSPLNLHDVDRCVSSLVQQLGLPVLLESAELGRSAARHACEHVVTPLRAQLGCELERRLVQRRDHNSEVAGLDMDERKRREERLFAAALLELLPRVKQLHKAEALVAWMSGTQPATPAATVDDGLHAIAEHAWQRAMDALAGAGEVVAVLQEVQHKRVHLAAARLHAAYIATDRVHTVPDVAQRRRACAEIDAQLVSPAVLLGTEPQRRQARWLQLELEAAQN